MRSYGLLKISISWGKNYEAKLLGKTQHINLLNILQVWSESTIEIEDQGS